MGFGDGVGRQVEVEIDSLALGEGAGDPGARLQPVGDILPRPDLGRAGLGADLFRQGDRMRLKRPVGMVRGKAKPASPARLQQQRLDLAG